MADEDSKSNEKNPKKDESRRFSTRFNPGIRLSGNLNRWSTKFNEKGPLDRAADLSAAIMSPFSRPSAETMLPESPPAIEKGTEKKLPSFEPPPRTRSSVQRKLNIKIDRSAFLAHLRDLSNKVETENKQKKGEKSIYQAVFDHEDEEHDKKKEKNPNSSIDKPLSLMVTAEELQINLAALNKQIDRIKKAKNTAVKSESLSDILIELCLLSAVWNFAIALYQNEEKKIEDCFSKICDFNCLEKPDAGLSTVTYTPSFHKKNTTNYNQFSSRITKILTAMFSSNPAIIEINFDEIALGTYYPQLQDNLKKIIREIKNSSNKETIEAIETSVSKTKIEP